MRIATLLMTLSCTSAGIAADTGPAPETLLQGLRGTWSGALEYRDYQSNDLAQIGVVVDFSTTADGATLIERAVFQDPGFEVHTVTVSTLDVAGTRQVAFFRDRQMQTYSQRVRVLESDGQGRNWTIRLERSGDDDDRPARIRETVRRAGDRLSWNKQVDFQDDATDEFEFRNRVGLELVPDS